MENSSEEKTEGIPQREEKILRFWKEKRIFESSLLQNEGKEAYVFYDGPPFATGLPHYGHLLQGTIKDVIPRYQTMRGRFVRREWGWDCHGLPLENLIEKELGIKQKSEIEEYGIENFNQKARESVMLYDSEWKSIVPRMGRWVDMERSYKTMDASYTESIWWSFKNLYDKKLIYEGYKSMHICPRCETTLAMSEVGMNYKDIKDISVYVEFELADELGTFLIAWTTTPWTLPGNVALAVNPDITYVKIEKQDEGTGALVHFIVAKDLLEKNFGTQGYTVKDTFLGKELIGRSYKPIFDYYTNDETLENRENAWKIVGADFVTTESGTGIVHEAPAFGEEDMALAKKLKLPMIQHVGMNGQIKPEVVDLAGKQAKPKEDPTATDVEVIKLLAAKGILFAKEKIEHSYPFCWRCDTPLLNYAASSWFVDVTVLKPRLLEENKDVQWIPENMRDGRFGRWLEGARDWAISRSRYWGAPLPVWKCNKCGKVEVFGSLKHLKQFTRSSNTYHVMRHGEAETNVKGIVSYKVEDPYSLTEKGRKQVHDAIEELQDKKIDLIIYSPILRTKETAMIVADALAINHEHVIADARISEIHTGDFNGCSIDTYRTYFTSTIEKFTKPSPHGETLHEMKTRIAEFLYDVDKKYQKRNILFVTHEYSTWLMDAVASGANDEQTAWMRVEGGDDYIKNAEVRPLDFAPIPHDRTFALDFHRPYVDEVVYHCSCELGLMQRVLDVFDCWYESGSMPYASVHYMGDDTTPEGKLFNKNFPADFIAEAMDQTRGWFYSLIVLSTALFDRAPFKSVVTTGLILAEDGQKMSKKLKNYPDPMMLVSKYGADALRLYMLSSPVVRGEDLRFTENGVDELYKKVLMRLDNVRSFYDLYANTNQILRHPPESTHVLDQWIVARLQETQREITDALDRHELDRATRPIAPLIDDLSTWYLRRSRERFKQGGSDSVDALSTLGHALFSIAKMIAPFMPFYAEDLYQRLPIEEKKSSVHLENWVLADAPDMNVINAMRRTRELVGHGLELRAKNAMKVRQPLAALVLAKLELADAYVGIIKDELNVKQVIVDPAQAEVMLDLTITPELKQEGQLRDLTRAIQEMRKKAGLHPHDEIILTLSLNEAAHAFVKNIDKELGALVRANSLIFAENQGEHIVIDDMNFTVTLTKV